MVGAQGRGEAKSLLLLLEVDEEDNKNQESFSLVSKEVVDNVPKQLAPGVADLSCDNQLYRSCTQVSSKLGKIIITKPQPFQCEATAEAMIRQDPARPTNGRRVLGKAETRVGQVANQGEEQAGQPAWPLLRRKLGD